MILYKYVSKDYLRESLQKKRLRISRFQELNDPFELASYDISDDQFRRAHRENVNNFVKDWGLVCLSRRWNSPVMWAHYAKNHEGACLEMEVEVDNICHVDYQEKKLFKGINLPNYKNFLTAASMRKIYGTKSKDWSYEEEVRFHVPLRNEVVIKDGENYFLKFQSIQGHKFLLKSVRIGYRCGVGILNLKKDLENYDPAVKVIQTRPAFGKFEVVEQEEENFWNIEEGDAESLPGVKAFWGGKLP